MSNEDSIGPAVLSRWLPSQCETTMFSCAGDDSLQPFSDRRGATFSESILQLPLDALAGLSINASSTHINSRKVKAVASGATGFRLAKKGPSGITICRGCVIVVFDGDLGLEGKTYFRAIEKMGQMTLIVHDIAVVQSSGRVNDGSECNLFTSEPIGNAIVFANDLELMKDCIKRIKEKGNGRVTPDSASAFTKYISGDESFTALRQTGIGDNRHLQFVLTWRTARSSIVDVAWLPEEGKRGTAAYTAEEIRNFWKLPEPVAVLPTVTKKDRDAMWLRLELTDKEASGAGLFLIRAHLGFVAIP